MSLFRKKKIKHTEFIQDPESFVQFVRMHDPEMVDFGIRSIAAAGPEVLEPMIQLFLNGQEQDTVRDRAGSVLARLGEPAIFPLLAILEKMEMSSQKDALNLGRIAAVFGKMGDVVIDPLTWALEQASKPLRYGAALGLVQTGDPKAIRAVKNAAERADENTRSIFMQVLASIGKQE